MKTYNIIFNRPSPSPEVVPPPDLEPTDLVFDTDIVNLENAKPPSQLLNLYHTSPTTDACSSSDTSSATTSYQRFGQSGFSNTSLHKKDDAFASDRQPPSDDCPEAVDIDALVPMNRYRKKGKLSVTDLSAQLWCETQLNFSLSTGRKRQTEAMLSGIQRHEALEKADHEIVDVEVSTNEENLGLRLLNTTILLDQLFQHHKARELWVFCIFDGVVFRGVIDELEIRSTIGNPATAPPSSLYTVISDTKTRREPKEPSMAQKRTSAIQLQTYCYILSQLRTAHTDFPLLFQLYNCDPSLPFNVPELLPYHNLAELSQLFVSKMMDLPPVRPEMEIVYECNGEEFSRNRIPYNEMATLYAIRDLLDWWEGHRTAEAVLSDEAWKCKYCEFVSECSLTPLDDTTKAAAIERMRQEDEAMQKSLSTGVSGKGLQAEPQHQNPPQQEVSSKYQRQHKDSPKASTGLAGVPIFSSLPTKPHLPSPFSFPYPHGCHPSSLFTPPSGSFSTVHLTSTPLNPCKSINRLPPSAFRIAGESAISTGPANKTCSGVSLPNKQTPTKIETSLWLEAKGKLPNKDVRCCKDTNQQRSASAFSVKQPPVKDSRYSHEERIVVGGREGCRPVDKVDEDFIMKHWLREPTDSRVSETSLPSIVNNGNEVVGLGREVISDVPVKQDHSKGIASKANVRNTSKTKQCKDDRKGKQVKITSFFQRAS